jgi:chitodextrinase
MATAIGGPYSQVGATTVSNFTVTGLISGTTYYFFVTAVDISGNTSGRSNGASATVL